MGEGPVEVMSELDSLELGLWVAVSHHVGAGS